MAASGRDCEFAAAPGSCPSAYGPGRPRAAFSVNQEFTLSATSGHPRGQQMAVPMTGLEGTADVR